MCVAPIQRIATVHDTCYSSMIKEVFLGTDSRKPNATMSFLKIPNPSEKEAILQRFVDDLESFTVYDNKTNTFRPTICCVCDSIPSNPDWSCFVPVKEAKKLFQHSNMESKHFQELQCPEMLMKQYSVPNGFLKDFVLSPASYINESNEILMCKQCYSELIQNREQRTNKTFPPKEAIASGYMIGDPPSVLTCLNDIELALVSRARIYCQSWVFFGGCHQHIQGWHTFYKNRPSENVGNLSQLISIGMPGTLLVVLCGPFTTTQKALTLKKTKVHPKKVVAAWDWLIKNNYRYRKETLPNIDEVPKPYVIDESKIKDGTENCALENQITITVVFPDSSLPQPTNGGFQNQEEFRKFIIQRQDGHWHSEYHARPHEDRLTDYIGDTIADAFPLQFPFGYTGMQEDPNVVLLQQQNKKHYSRHKTDVLKKYLRHRKPAFHGPMFNLVIYNLMMKDLLFLKCRIFCNAKFSENVRMGEKYGSMTANQLERAICKARLHPGSHSLQKETGNRFLNSVYAGCRLLPHSNEATRTARQTYFSYCIAFGLPCIFLTITPDDLRNFRLVVYSLVEGKFVSGMENVNQLSDDQILIDFKVRTEVRFQHPGLCAEEYHRIVNLVIKHLFNWDMENQKSNGMGLFAEIDAFCLATEEQGRKTLHGHFLIFVKNWNQVLTVLQHQGRNNDHLADALSLSSAIIQSKAFYANACSAQLFSDFDDNGPLNQVPVFSHKNAKCVRKRKQKDLNRIIEPVSNQMLRNMRHKKLCHVHNGQIATCTKCQEKIYATDIVANALNVHLGDNNNCFSFPDGNVKRLDKQVYEFQKDFQWISKDDHQKSIRYFASNALVNFHLVKHATRCFKKGPECYANLPDSVSQEIEIVYNEDYDIWSDYQGVKERRYMLRFQPKRLLEDAYINVHNPSITSLLGCNTNVMVGMNGPVVIYVTGYNAKPQQKDEGIVYENVSRVLIKTLQNQVSMETFLNFYISGLKIYFPFF